MTYQSQVLSIPGLVGFWPLNDTAGATTALDLGPNNLPLTYSVAKPSGPQLLQDYGSSLAGDGSSVFAYRAVPNGSPLQITGTFSIGCWIQAANLPSANDFNLINRSSNWSIIWKKQQFLQSAPRITGGTGTSTFVNGTFPPAANQTYFVGISWDGQEITLWVNGEFDYKDQYIGGSIATTTDRFDVLSLAGSQPAAINIGGVFVSTHALTAGEWKTLYLAGTTATSLPVEGDFYNFTFDQYNPAVANAATANSRCPVCAGQMRINEPSVTDTGLVYHSGCYGARLIARPLTYVSSSSTIDQVCQDAVRLIHDQTLAYALHSDNAKLRYHDGTVFHFDISQGTGVTSTFQRSTSGIASGMVAVYKYLGLPKDHWTIAIAMKLMANDISMQNADGTFGSDGSPNAQFILQDMGECIIFLKDVVPVSTLSAWKTSFILGCNKLQSTATYYVNGNIEIATTYIFWLAYVITGDQTWHTNYSNHMNFTIFPTQSGQTNQFGLYFLQPDGSYAIYPNNMPANSDWSDGQGFLAESGGSTPGLDYDYLQVQMNVVVRLWHMSKDPMALKLMNVFINLAMNVTNNGVKRLNTTTWVWDATNGSRHSLSTSFETPIFATLIWGGLRTDLDVTFPASQWGTKVRPDYLANQGTNNQNFWRGIGDYLGLWIMSSPNWVPNTIPGQI